MKIICHRISIQTLLFHACMPTRQSGVENRDKTYSNRNPMKSTPKLHWCQRRATKGIKFAEYTITNCNASSCISQLLKHVGVFVT